MSSASTSSAERFVHPLEDRRLFSVMIFETTAGGPVADQNYGDRITGPTVGTFRYGALGGTTPNVVAEYNGAAPWPADYGDLKNVNYVSAAPMEITLRADAGFKVGLRSFDLGGWPNKDYTIAAVQVLDGTSNTVLFSKTNQKVEGDMTGPRHTSFNFSPLVRQVLKIRIDSRNLGGEADNIGIDNIQFSQFRGGGIYGQKFDDRNDNGRKDTGEPGLPNWRIYLDADNDRVFDSTERSTVTDSRGDYRFDGLAAGTHRVREVLQSGWRLTTPAAPGTHVVSLTTGQVVVGKLFGNTRRTRITGTVFNDANGDKVRQSTEGGLANFTVFLDADDDGVLDTNERRIVTTSTGAYSFTNLAAGTHRVRIVPRAGFAGTTPTGGLHTVTLTSGQVASAKNFGQRQVPQTA